MCLVFPSGSSERTPYGHDASRRKWLSRAHPYKQPASRSPWDCFSPTWFSSITVFVFAFLLLRQQRSLLPWPCYCVLPQAQASNHKLSFLRAKRGGCGRRRGLSQLSQLVPSLQEAGRPLASRHPREPVQSIKATQDPRQNTSNNPTKCFVGWRRAKKKKRITATIINSA